LPGLEIAAIGLTLAVAADCIRHVHEKREGSKDLRPGAPTAWRRFATAMPSHPFPAITHSFLSGSLAASCQFRFHSKNNIRITGSARKRIVSDLIQWSATIEAKAPERTAAYMALKTRTDKAVEFLKAQGLKAEEIQPQSASLIGKFNSLKRRAEPASVRPVVRRTCPGVASAETDGGVNEGRLMGQKPIALPIASS
jgi:hypothetical protein